jgi:hypothetical protein
VNDRRKSGRRGSASLEAVMATAVSLPVAVALFYVGIRASRGLYFLVGHLVGWPYM